MRVLVIEDEAELLADVCSALEATGYIVDSSADGNEGYYFATEYPLDVAIIARVPFDEGTLTGTLTKETRWPEGDWRNTYFVPENLNASVDRAEALRPLIPAGMTMPEMALRFILANPSVSTIIPGMRKLRHVQANIATSDGQALPADLIAQLRAHRWDRTPTEWSQ